MIRILFIDASALLSFFVSDKGTPTMRWLMSSDNKAYNSTRYVINNQVVAEFESELKALVTQNELKKTTADNILTLFNNHYKKRKFKVVGKNASVQETMEGMYNFLGRISRPILVTCNPEQIANNKSYKIINPQSQTSKEIACMLRGKKKKIEDTKENNIYRKFFGKTKTAITL